MNNEQLNFSDYIFKELNRDYGKYKSLTDLNRTYKKQSGSLIESFDLKFIIDELNYQYIETHIETDDYIKITPEGKKIIDSYGSYSEYKKQEYEQILSEIEEQNETKRIQKQINELTIKQLKGNIFQIKNWWWILILNAIVTFIIGFLLLMLD
jgi:hypothetical protein